MNLSPIFRWPTIKNNTKIISGIAILAVKNTFKQGEAGIEILGFGRRSDRFF